MQSSSSRLPGLLASTSRSLRAGQLHARRQVHHRRELPYDLAEGLNPLFTPETLQMLAVEYQSGLLERLNDLVAGTASENSSVAQTVINTAQDRSQALAFNLASEALNNSYFLSRLTPDSKAQQLSQSSDLRSKLGIEFGSWTAFKHTFSSAAMGMSGSGYLWLVMDSHDNMGIVGTFGAGTPLVQSRQQRGDAPPTLGEVTQPASIVKPAATPTPPKAASDPFTKALKANADQLAEAQQPAAASTETGGMTKPVRPVGELNPLLCLSVQEHSWLRDYGIWGKQKYIENWWSVIDWSKVESTHQRLAGVKTSAYFIAGGDQ